MEPGIKGIQNLKNTCYINSTIQLLSHIDPLRTFFCEDLPFSSESNTPYYLHSILKALSDLFQQIWSESQSKVIPKAFVSKCFEIFPQFPPFTQQDSEEFLMNLIDRIDSELKDGPALIKHLFAGCYIYRYRCKTCNTDSESSDSFRQLNIQIPQNVPNINTLDSLMSELEINIISKQRPGFFDVFDIFSKEKARMNLYYCLFSYFFNSNTQKFCGNCGELKDHNTNVSMMKYPKYLIVSLKRFKYRYWNRKISENVFMPSVLDFGKMMDGGVSYELAAVIEHSGFSFRGHYKCFVCCSGQWWVLNDLKVRKCLFEEVFTAQAYIALYKLIA